MSSQFRNVRFLPKFKPIQNQLIPLNFSSSYWKDKTPYAIIPYKLGDRIFMMLSMKLGLRNFRRSSVGEGVVSVEMTDEESRLNVNTAGEEVIMSLSDNLAADIADEIIAFRVENPFQTKLDFKNNISISEDVYNEIGKFIDVKSNYFSITSSGSVNQSQKTIRAEIMRQNNKAKIIYWRVE